MLNYCIPAVHSMDQTKASTEKKIFYSAYEVLSINCYTLQISSCSRIIANTDGTKMRKVRSTSQEFSRKLCYSHVLLGVGVGKGNSESHSLLKLLLNLKCAVDNILFCIFRNWRSVNWLINIIQAFLCLSWEFTCFFQFPLVHTKKGDFATTLENWNCGMKNMLVLRNIYISHISKAKAFLLYIQKMEIYR